MLSGQLNKRIASAVVVLNIEVIQINYNAINMVGQPTKHVWVAVACPPQVDKLHPKSFIFSEFLRVQASMQVVGKN